MTSKFVAWHKKSNNSVTFPISDPFTFTPKFEEDKRDDNYKSA